MFNKRCCSDMPNQGMMMPQMGMEPMMDSCNREVVEPTINKCIEREFYHEVPHICPIHTHVVNKHIYKHTYTPQYSCSEENQVCNIDCGGCSGF